MSFVTTMVLERVTAILGRRQNALSATPPPCALHPPLLLPRAALLPADGLPGLSSSSLFCLVSVAWRCAERRRRRISHLPACSLPTCTGDGVRMAHSDAVTKISSIAAVTWRIRLAAALGALPCLLLCPGVVPLPAIAWRRAAGISGTAGRNGMQEAETCAVRRGLTAQFSPSSAEREQNYGA